MYTLEVTPEEANSSAEREPNDEVGNRLSISYSRPTYDASNMPLAPNMQPNVNCLLSATSTPPRLCSISCLHRNA